MPSPLAPYEQSEKRACLVQRVLRRRGNGIDLAVGQAGDAVRALWRSQVRALCVHMLVHTCTRSRSRIRTLAHARAHAHAQLHTLVHTLMNMHAQTITGETVPGTQRQRDIQRQRRGTRLLKRMNVCGNGFQADFGCAHTVSRLMEGVWKRFPGAEL
eukprot:1499331-Rhodomonas_salina.1